MGLTVCSWYYHCRVIKFSAEGCSVVFACHGALCKLEQGVPNLGVLSLGALKSGGHPKGTLAWGRNPTTWSSKLGGTIPFKTSIFLLAGPCLVTKANLWSFLGNHQNLLYKNSVLFFFFSKIGKKEPVKHCEFRKVSKSMFRFSLGCSALKLNSCRI